MGAAGDGGGRRRLPVLLAVLGIAIPMAADLLQGSGGWPMGIGWLVVLLVFAWLSPAVLPTRRHRMTTAVLLLPTLGILLAWEGGWWLLPADLTWLVIEWRSPEIATSDVARS